ncbi:MAG TPA: NUDIX hydrolase [Verrucomicrobiae bacterium]|nr:NUDIX hydrolase [Verrucomicrobiae bacterium]
MSGDIRLATGLAIRDGRVLLVASRYRSHAQALWNLPGGRVASGELLRDAVVREVAEETGLRANVSELAYVSESYDGTRHVFNATFLIDVSGSIAEPASDDHVEAVEWVPIDRLAERISVAVVRDPLVHFLRDRTRYYGFADAGITIEWPEEP